MPGWPADPEPPETWRTPPGYRGRPLTIFSRCRFGWGREQIVGTPLTSMHGSPAGPGLTAKWHRKYLTPPNVHPAGKVTTWEVLDRPMSIIAPYEGSVSAFRAGSDSARITNRLSLVRVAEIISGDDTYMVAQVAELRRMSKLLPNGDDNPAYKAQKASLGGICPSLAAPAGTRRAGCYRPHSGLYVYDLDAEKAGAQAWQRAWDAVRQMPATALAYRSVSGEGVAPDDSSHAGRRHVRTQAAPRPDPGVAPIRSAPAAGRKGPGCRQRRPVL